MDHFSKITANKNSFSQKKVQIGPKTVQKPTKNDQNRVKTNFSLVLCLTSA